jgi:hypothetical protein
MSEPAESAAAANDNEGHGQPNSSSSLRISTKERRSFRASDLKRALRTLQAIGISAKRVEIEPDGRIIVIVSAASSVVPDDALNKWLARHARSA